jgi:hypothetical protein
MTATLTDRQKLVEQEIKKYTIDEGWHSEAHLRSKVSCIMEAMCLVLGYQPYTGGSGGRNPKLAGYLNPPCISVTVKEVLVSINDALKTNRDRGALKKFAPQILNTAPTVTKERVLKTKTVKELKQDKQNPKYKAAEKIRRKMARDAGLLGNVSYKVSYKDQLKFLYTENGAFRKKHVENFLQELIDVAHF